MKSIFNSLGSNYSFSFVMLALKQMISNGDDKAIDKLHKYLEKEFDGRSFLFYKGRDAIEFALRVLLSQDESLSVKGKIMTQAFSCYAVEEGIKRAGATPAYVDIDENSTNMSVKTLSKAFEKNKDSKVVLVQHSLGIPAEIIEIKKWCKKNNLLLIEDLAQAIGGTDSTGEKLGRHADAVVFSFGRDKIIDAVSGGAVVFKKLPVNQQDKIEALLTDEVSTLSKNIIFKDMLYPAITFFGTKTHDIFFGKVALKLFRSIGLITSPTISSTSKLSFMHSAYAQLVNRSFINLDNQLLHRRKIANFYFDRISNPKIKILSSKQNIDSGSNLRFSIRVSEVDRLIKLMKTHKVYLSDRWYRKAVDCGKQDCGSEYKSGHAVNAEKLASEIFNLPTHFNITEDKAKKIVDILNKF